MSNPIIVIGAGLSGLAAAFELEQAGEEAIILEAANHIGGKLETTLFQDAYRLDRGFQVLLPAYPELKRLGDLESELSLKYFNSGARLEMDTGPVLMADPIRHPSNLISTCLADYGTIKDKLLVLKLQAETRYANEESLLQSDRRRTLEFLRSYGFSEKIIDSFWLPFFSGIFLESELRTSAGFFKFLVSAFGRSPVAVPRLGIGHLPESLSKKLRRSEIRLSTKVKSRDSLIVELVSGEKIRAKAVIGPETSAFMPHVNHFGSVTSYWFKAPEPPFEGAWLSLNSRSTKTHRLLNHVAVLSNVSPEYALKGDSLICANVVGHPVLDNVESVLDEARELYGPTVKDWKILREDRIDKAFPLYFNRSDSDTPSQQGALQRGRRAAREALARL